MKGSARGWEGHIVNTIPIICLLFRQNWTLFWSIRWLGQNISLSGANRWTVSGIRSRLINLHYYNGIPPTSPASFCSLNVFFIFNRLSSITCHPSSSLYPNPLPSSSISTLHSVPQAHYTSKCHVLVNYLKIELTNKERAMHPALVQIPTQPTDIS